MPDIEEWAADFPPDQFTQYIVRTGQLRLAKPEIATNG